MENVWVLRSGKCSPSSIAEATVLLTERRPPVVWVAADDPAELPGVARSLGIEPRHLVVVGAGLAHRTARAHLDHLEGGGVALTVPTVRFAQDALDVRTGRVTCVVVGSVILTAEEGDAGVLDLVHDELDARTPLPERGPRKVLAALLGALVRAVSDVEAALGEAVADAERLVFSPGTDDPVGRVYHLKREVAQARRALVPLGSELLEVVDDEQDVRQDADAARWLRRLQSSVERVDRRLTAHDQLLADMLSVHLSQVSVRQNEDMRKISSWAAIAAVPTLLAGVYGMNFRHMPELGWQYGYPLALAGMVAVCVGLYAVFKRSGWL
ncbi:magnesium and cobalt transport protein CorA [Cellulomonas sp. P22]|uniref:magnesium and cobalt transport protein CorA n=1 Tax=Cellulomonas sp. P22 TaxID=3373189 RepID=UPI00379F1BE5